VAILSNFLPGCSKADLSVRCAVALGASAHQTKIEASVAGSRVTIAGTELILDAKIENETHQGSSWVIGIAVITSGAGNTFSAGSVGVGTSRADALDTAIAEWAALAGVAIVRALVLKEHADERFVLGGFIVYPGATGFRGPEQPSWSKDDQSQLFGRLMPVMAGLPAQRLHSVSLSVLVEPIGDVQGDCRLDGTISSDVLDDVKKFPWPRLKTSYIFKQYYIVETPR
jgi:hypothetical protein